MKKENLGRKVHKICFKYIYSAIFVSLPAFFDGRTDFVVEDAAEQHNHHALNFPPNIRLGPKKIKQVIN